MTWHIPVKKGTNYPALYAGQCLTHTYITLSLGLGSHLVYLLGVRSVGGNRGGAPAAGCGTTAVGGSTVAGRLGGTTPAVAEPGARGQSKGPVVETPTTCDCCALTPIMLLYDVSTSKA